MAASKEEHQTTVRDTFGTQFRSRDDLVELRVPQIMDGGAGRIVEFEGCASVRRRTAASFHGALNEVGYTE